MPLVAQTVANEFEFSIATVPPTARQRRLAAALIIVLFIGFSVTAPFAATQLAPNYSFVPAIEAIDFVTDLVTAGLLFSKFPVIGLRAVLVLASAYLFSALAIIPHALSYPGVLTVSGGLFGSGLQTTPWLFTFWHLGFCVAVLVYASVKDGKHEYMAPSSRPRAILWSIGLVVCLVCGLTWIAVAGEKFLPRLVLPDVVRFSALANYVTITSLCTSLIALVLLKIRQKSILDLWLSVAMVATVAEQAVVSLFIASRFSVGFYSSKIFSVVVSTIVLLALLSETINLYARLSRANTKLQRERESKLINVAAAVAAMSHEIRQPLTAIITKSAAARRFLARGSAEIERIGGILDDIGNASLRANQIIESVGALFRSNPEQQSIDINNLVIEALQVLRDELADCSITVDTQLTSELPPIMGHEGQLQEVILNLVQNSIDAMRTMTTKPRMVHVSTAPHGRDAIAISVEDTGPGIEEKTLGGVFDAFVTTKTKGMGVGLALSKMIVERHDGQISAMSGVNGGARFEITLPIKSDSESIPAS
jgi:signal transduction histidine kinase